MAEDLEEDFEEGAGGDEGGMPSGGGGRRRLLLFIAVPVLVIVLAAVGAYFGGLLDPLLKLFHGSKPPPPAAAAPAVPAGTQAVFYDMPELLVNLNSAAPGRKQSFLKIRVSLELANPLDVPKIEAVMPRIIDNFQVYLRELRVDDLQGSAGMLRLREELLARVNAAVKPAKVADVLFKEMLVQ